MLEIDPVKLCSAIEAAERAISARLQQLEEYSGDRAFDRERQAIGDAMRALSLLRRSADNP